MGDSTSKLRQGILSRLGLVGLALTLSLGMTGAAGIGPIPVSEASAQEPMEQFRLCFWGVEICIAQCIPGFGFCCDGYPEPLL